MTKRLSKSRKKSAERTPPSGDTPRAQHFPQPARRSGEDQLPVVALGSVDMERFCRALVSIAYPGLRGELKRTRGKAQFGVDIEGFDRSQRPIIVVSCKCYIEAEARDLLPWTREFTKHLDGHWKDKGIETFVLAVTCDGNDDALNAAARVVAQHLEAFGIGFELWTNQRMSDFARGDPGLVGLYFSGYWQEAFSPRGSSAGIIAGAVANALATPAIAALSAEIAALLSERERDLVRRLDAAQAEFRAGRVSCLAACLDEIQGLAHWPALSGGVRAKALRARALLCLHMGDGPAALDLIDDADRASPPLDRALRTVVVRMTHGPDGALALLDAPRSDREFEVRASLLLELGEPDRALGELSCVSAQSAECMRLKAIVSCLKGERVTAIELAEEARRSEPNSALVKQTIAILHVMAALSPAAEVQFGAMPNPFDPGLVNGTEDALLHLAQAEALFANLAAELEPPSKAEAEVWQLACLILHVDRRAHARRLARTLLGRDAVEPVAVAWCRFAGLPLRVGHVRKLLADALRNGSGTPSHIVVDALLAVDKDGAAAGAAVIDRHAALFPEASLFLDGWRARFVGTVDRNDPVAAALAAPSEADRFTVLATAISAEPRSGDIVLAAAGLMAVHGAWTELRSIQTRLIEVGTPRAVTIAAHAAYNSGNPAEALQILDAGKTRFRHGELPPSLLDLTARAHDALGDKRRAIDGYEQVLTRTNDPGARRRLIQSYLGVGNLGSARHHAEHYVFGKDADPVDAVALADVWKASDPEFSRRLILHAAADPALPVEAAPQAFALAIELGLKEVEARLAPIVFDIETHGQRTGVMAVDTATVIAEIQRRAEGARQSFSEWLGGRRWSHATWATDPRAFALLFLAEPDDRVDPIGQLLPMLIRTVGFERPTPALPDAGKPLLVIDISALLIAARLTLVDAISEAFTIRIPEALPAALLEIEQALPQLSPSMIDAARRLLTSDTSGLRLVAVAPAEAVSLAQSDDATEPNPLLLAAALRSAVDGGHLSREAADTAAGRFTIRLDDTASPALPAEILLSARLALRLSESGVLAAIAQAVPISWTDAERAALARDLAQGERWQRYRELVVGLRRKVADRLLDSSWTTLPKRLDRQADARRDKMRPHVLSLAECAGAVETGLAALFWIEDRFVQRSGEPRLVDVMHILRLLEERNAVTPAEHAAHRTELRRIGYGFEAPDIDTIMRDLAAGPIAGEQLVETTELRLWRSWFAREVDHLQHCDRTPMHDGSGCIAGEARHVLDLMATARDLLWSIWCESQASDAAKAVRSGWVWTNLRLEQMPFFPVVAANPLGATNLVAQSIAHIADAPLQSLLLGEPHAAGPAKSFLTWLFGDVIDSRCAADTEFEAPFADNLVRTVVGVLGWVDDETEGVERERIRRHIAGHTSAYLDLLPVVWRERLLADPTIAERLEATTVLTANIAGRDFDAARLAQAMTEAIGASVDGYAVERTIADRRGQQLTLKVAGGKASLPAVTLELGRKVLAIDPMIVAVHLAKPQQRLDALRAISTGLDGPPDERDRRLETLARLTTVADRIDALRTLHAQDFSLACERVRDGVRHKERVERADLTLPTPSVLQAYLRMTDADLQDLADLPDRLFARLADELGVKAAVARLAGCPFRPRTDTITRIAGALGGPSDWARVEDLRFDTALEALGYLRTLTENSSVVDPLRNTLVDALIDRLLPQSPLFIAFLARAARRAWTDPRWRAIPQEVAALLIWVWADRVTAALIAGGADPEEVAAVVEAEAPRGLLGIIDPDQEPGWWRQTVAALDDGRLLTGVIAEILTVIGYAAMPPATSKRLLDTAGHFVAETWMPRLDASFPSRAGPTGYWPAEDPVTKIAGTGATKLLSPFDVRAPDNYVRALLGEEIADAQLPAMLAVLSFVDVSQLELDTAILLRQRMPELLGRTYASPGTPGYRRGLALLTAAVAATGSTDDCDALITGHARRMAAQWPDARIASSVFENASEPHQGFSMLVEMVLVAGRHLAVPLLDKVQWIARATESIVEAWPEAVQGAVTFIDRSIARLPVRNAPPLWSAFNRLRARR